MSKGMYHGEYSSPQEFLEEILHVPNNIAPFVDWERFIEEQGEYIFEETPSGVKVWNAYAV